MKCAAEVMTMLGLEAGVAPPPALASAAALVDPLLAAIDAADARGDVEASNALLKKAEERARARYAARGIAAARGGR